MGGEFCNELGPASVTPAFILPNFLHRRDPSDKVDGGPSQEGCLADCCGGEDPGIGIFSSQKIVEHRRRLGGRARGLLWQGDSFESYRFPLGESYSFRPLCPGFHPGIQERNLFGLQGLSFIRHHPFVDRAEVDPDQDLTLCGIARHDSIGRLAAFQELFMRIHSESALDL